MLQTGLKRRLKTELKTGLKTGHGAQWGRMLLLLVALGGGCKTPIFGRVAAAAVPADTTRGGAPAKLEQAGIRVPAARPALCQKWTIVRDKSHPEWPGHYQEEVMACAPGQRSERGPETDRVLETTHPGEKIRLSFTTGKASTELLVTALEGGAPGDVIRCRSTLDGTILWGRLLAGAAALLVLRQASQSGRIEQTEGAW